MAHRTRRRAPELIARWTRDRQPDPIQWVAQRSSEATSRNTRAALIRHFRVNVGRTLDIPWMRPVTRPVASDFTVTELAVSRAAVDELHDPPPGKRKTLVGACPHRVQDRMRTLDCVSELRVHAHKLRAAFATHLLQRGVGSAPCRS